MPPLSTTPTYADLDDLEAYIEGWVTDNAQAANRLLVRAERDVDLILGPLPRRSDNGLKLKPAELQGWEADALARAVCAQAEHRFRMGDELDARQATTVRGPDFEVTYEAGAGGGRTLYSPRVALELAPIAHLRRLTARARG